LFSRGPQSTTPQQISPDQTSGHPPLRFEEINQSHSKDAPKMESKCSENKINDNGNEGHVRKNLSQHSRHSVNREISSNETLNVNQNANLQVDTNVSLEKREKEISSHVKSSSQPQPITNSQKPKNPTFLSTKEQGLLDKLKMRRSDKQKVSPHFHFKRNV
jgi:hypothetical protein